MTKRVPQRGRHVDVSWVWWIDRAVTVRWPGAWAGRASEDRVAPRVTESCDFVEQQIPIFFRNRVGITDQLGTVVMPNHSCLELP